MTSHPRMVRPPPTTASITSIASITPPRIRRAVAILGLFMILPGTSPLPAAPPEHPTVRTELVAPGRYVFERHCMLCHGRRGNGRGELASATVPRPRDFTRGVFKYRSTPPGHLPTDSDLARTIQSGLSGTAMPAFTQLPDRDVGSVIEFIKSLSPRWTNAIYHARPIELPPEPGWLADPGSSRVHAGRGRLLFQRACAPCHGEQGAGDGPAAPGLVDEWDQPCPPRDLRLPHLRTGTSPGALHRTLLTGLDGTPMPSFAAVTTESERWDLVAFLLELRTPPPLPGPPDDDDGSAAIPGTE